MVRVRSGEIGTQFALDAHTARTVYALLSAHREQVDSRFGRSVNWRVVTGRMHEIDVRRTAELAARETWPELFLWLRANLDAFLVALGPFVARSIPLEHDGDWDEASFFEGLGLHNPQAVAPARALLEWSRTSMPVIYWGHGRQVGSFVPSVRHRGIEHSVISVWTDGLFVVRFAALKKQPPFDDEGRRRELLARLNALPCVDLPEAVLDRYPSLPLALLEEPGARAGLLETLDWCVRTVRSSRTH